jgi:hypothetical protein
MMLFHENTPLTFTSPLLPILHLPDFSFTQKIALVIRPALIFHHWTQAGESRRESDKNILRHTWI